MNFLATETGYIRKQNIFYIQKISDTQTKIYINNDFQLYFTVNYPIEMVLELVEG